MEFCVSHVNHSFGDGPKGRVFYFFFLTPLQKTRILRILDPRSIQDLCRGGTNTVVSAAIWCTRESLSKV